MNERTTALALLLGIKESEIEVYAHDECFLEVNGDYYLVYTDDEANDAWEESMDNYIDEIVLEEIPEHLRGYFDYKGFKHDCSFDGRGHTLASYDGQEEEIEVEGTTYYIYRT